MRLYSEDFPSHDRTVASPERVIIIEHRADQPVKDWLRDGVDPVRVGGGGCDRRRPRLYGTCGDVKRFQIRAGNKLL